MTDRAADNNVIDLLRANLIASGTRSNIRIGFLDAGGSAFMKASFIEECIDTLEQRLQSAVAFDDPNEINALERLAIHLLTASARINLANDHE